MNNVHQETYIECVKNIVDEVRKITSAPVVLGGSGFSVMPEEVLEMVGAEYGIVGEGEQLFCEIAELIKSGKQPAHRILRAPLVLEGRTIPSAMYDRELMEFYHKHGKMISIQTKRGCDRNCVYCSYPILEGRRVRGRDPKAVVDDIQALIKDHDAQYIFFVDSVFNDSQGLYRLVIEEMLRREVKIKWTAFFSPGGDLDAEIIAKMKKTGLHAAEIGADAACDKTLIGIGKSFNWQGVVDCNDLFIEQDITTAHYYMFGGPGETKKTVEKGIANIKALRHTVNFMFLGIRLLPNTGLIKIAERQGVIKPGQKMLEPIYYFSPEISRDWLENELTEGFKDHTNCVFPPDALNDKLRLLQKLGVSGSAYELLANK